MGSWCESKLIAGGWDDTTDALWTGETLTDSSACLELGPNRCRQDERLATSRGSIRALRVRCRDRTVDGVVQSGLLLLEGLLRM